MNEDPRDLARRALAAAKRQDDLAAARQRLAEGPLGDVLAERLNGSTVEELEADAVTLLEAVGKATATPAPADGTEDPLLAQLKGHAEKSAATYESIFGEQTEDSP